MSYKSAVGFVCSEWTCIRSGSSHAWCSDWVFLVWALANVLVNGLNLGVSVVRIVWSSLRSRSLTVNAIFDFVRLPNINKQTQIIDWATWGIHGVIFVNKWRYHVKKQPIDQVVQELWKVLPTTDVFHVCIHCAIWSAVWMHQLVNSVLKYAAIVYYFIACLQAVTGCFFDHPSRLRAG